MKNILKLLPLVLLFIALPHSEGQSPYTNPGASLFDSLRKKNKPRTNSLSKKSNQEKEIERTSSSGDLTNKTVKITNLTSTNVTQSNKLTLLSTNAPPKTAKSSELGFFPDKSATNAPPSKVSTNALSQKTSSSPIPAGSFLLDNQNDGATFGSATREAILEVSGKVVGDGGTKINPEALSEPVSKIPALPATSSTNALPTKTDIPITTKNLKKAPTASPVSLSEKEIMDLIASLEEGTSSDTNSPVKVINSADYEGKTTDYKIQPGDIIGVEVFLEPDLTKELKVAASGEITYPLLKQVKVSGKSAAQAERYIRDLLERDYLVDPHVIITVKEFKAQQISVQGFVNIPKLITLPPDQPMTIMQALSEAGGIQRLGNPNRIELIRQGKPNESFKLKDLKEVSDPSKILYLQPNDVVYVYERGLF